MRVDGRNDRVGTHFSPGPGPDRDRRGRPGPGEILVPVCRSLVDGQKPRSIYARENQPSLGKVVANAGVLLAQTDRLSFVLLDQRAQAVILVPRIQPLAPRLVPLMQVSYHVWNYTSNSR